MKDRFCKKFNAKQKDCFNDLGVEKYVIVATFDDRTADICQELDGQVFDMKDYEVGSTSPLSIAIADYAQHRVLMMISA